MDLISIIEARRKLGLMSVFFTYLSECESDLLRDEGYDLVGTEEGIYVFY